MAGNGMKSVMSVDLRIPKVPGFDEATLVAMVQQIMGELQQWAPLTPPQELADAACKVVGDVVPLGQFRMVLAEAPTGSRWRMDFVRPMRVRMGDESLATVELSLEAPVRLSECKDQNDFASFATMVGYITSPVMRSLTALQGMHVRISPPASTGTPIPGDGTPSS
jgi:hypothetical protein